MCLSIPMKIVSINGDLAEVESGGVARKVSILFLDEANVDEYVLVHAGFAISRLDEKSAIETLELFKNLSITS